MTRMSVGTGRENGDEQLEHPCRLQTSAVQTTKWKSLYNQEYGVRARDRWWMPRHLLSSAYSLTSRFGVWSGGTIEVVEERGNGSEKNTPPRVASAA